MTRLIHTRLRALRGNPDSGIALVTVIAVTAVLGILVVSAVAFSIGGMRKAQTGQSWNGAMAAAYAGVEEYQSQLSNDPAYGRYGNSASSFTGPGSALPPRPNPAFGLGKTGTWAKVPGSEQAATFRYEVDNSKLFTHGTLRVRSTGKVGTETRSVVVDLKQNGFGDYVYFTNYETADPFNTASRCYRYAYDGRPGAPECVKIAFGNGDVLDGPVHSNDRIVIDCGAKFLKPITTGYKPSSGEAYEQGVGGCRPTFFEGKAPVSRGVLEMPPTNSEMKKEVRFDLAEEVPVPGCLYTGPTTVTFNADGTMQVKSPWTKKVQISATAGRDNPACGVPGTAAGQLGSSGGAKIQVPDNNVVFVQNVPNVAGDPNTSAVGVTDPTGTCKGSDAKNPVGYPLRYGGGRTEVAPSSSSYQCRNGDVFVQGNLKGKLTIAAENNVYVVGNIAYADRERDVLGLVGQNSVIVHNPIRDVYADQWDRKNAYPLLDSQCGADRRIDASILSVAHTFMVQNTDTIFCYSGKLQVTGSIAQMFRGIVYQNSGYKKEYRYDSRLSYVSPPKFLSPANIVFGVSTWSEINPVMKADGSYA